MQFRDFLSGRSFLVTKKPIFVLTIGGGVSVQYVNCYKLMRHSPLCISEILLRDASFSLKNMLDFVVSYERRLCCSNMGLSSLRQRQVHLLFTCAALHISSRTSAIGFIHPYKVVRKVYRKSGDFVLTYGRRFLMLTTGAFE